MDNCNSPIPVEGRLDLEAIEREVEAFASTKAKASPGRWHRGAWFERCQRHRDGEHPGLNDPANPCVISRELTRRGDHSSYISTDDQVLIGSDSDGPVLSPEDAEFVVVAKNSDLEVFVKALVVEVRRLRLLLNEK
jgi:hypothetical protein